MKAIYKIENKVNHKIYIGQSKTHHADLVNTVKIIKIFIQN